LRAEQLDRLAGALGTRARREEPLAPYTSMHVGGPADLLAICSTADEVIEAACLAEAHDVPWWVLGGGCNVLVADAGVRGLVILNRANGVQIESGGRVRAQAGTLVASLAQTVASVGLAGLEWAAGLPGTVGGAVVGNAGAFEGDIAAVLEGVALLERDGSVVERPVEWLGLSYRASRIKRQPLRERPAVLEATFSLQPGDAEQLAQRMAEIVTWRRTRHPAGLTMGSTFKNPPGGHAGRMIEEAGMKGRASGGVRVSEKHANFLINTGQATAQEALALIRCLQTGVEERFGVVLELEVELIGDWEREATAVKGEPGRAGTKASRRG